MREFGSIDKDDRFAVGELHRGAGERRGGHEEALDCRLVHQYSVELTDGPGTNRFVWPIAFALHKVRAPSEGVRVCRNHVNAAIAR